MKSKSILIPLIVLIALGLMAGFVMATRAMAFPLEDGTISALNLPDRRPASFTGGEPQKLDQDMQTPAHPAEANAFGSSGGSGMGGDFLVSTSASYQDEPAIAHNSTDDEFLLVWDEGSDVYGQIFSVQGIPQGGSFPISTAAGSQFSSSAVYNPAAGQYLVVWQDQRNGNADIYGQLVAADGSLPGGADPSVNFPISTDADSQSSPVVAYNTAADEYLVVWEDFRSGSDFHIYGQRVDADGSLLGNTDPSINFQISSAANGQLDPAIAYNPLPADEYLVVFRSSGTDYDIYGQRVDSNGTLLSAAIPISTKGSSQYEPDIAYNATADEYLVVWEDVHTSDDIYGQRVDADGSLLDNPGTPQDEALPGVNFAITEGRGILNCPSVAYSAGHNQYLVVWEDFRRSVDSEYDIYGQRVGSNGSLAGQGDFAISNGVRSQVAPVLAYSDTSQQYLVVWEDWRSGFPHIYGQRVWWPGLPVGHEFAVSGPGTQQTPAVAYDSREHQYLAVWADDADGDFDIYGQLYHRNGHPLGWPFAIMDLEGDQINPAVAYNRDDRNYLVVFEGPGGIAGRFVTSQGSNFGDAFFIFEASGLHRPDVAYAHNADSGDQGFLVVYDVQMAGGDKRVVGQIVSDDGGPGSVLQISPVTGADNLSPDVVYNPDDNQFLVAWHGDQGGTWDIYGQRIAVDGTLEGATLTVSNAARGQQHPDIVYNPDQNQYLVVWDDFRNGSDFELYAQKVDADGSLNGGNLAVTSSSAGADQNYPAMIYADTVDRYHLVWQDDRDAGTLGWDLYGKWLGSDGTNPASLDAPLMRYTSDQQKPAIAYSEGSQYNAALTLWEDDRRGSSDIYASFSALDDEPPVARFNRTPRIGRAGNTFYFNARPSYDASTPRGDLLVRWDFNSDGTWDTALSHQKYVAQTINLAGIYTVTLEVWDSALMTDTISLLVAALPAGGGGSSLQATLSDPPTTTLTVSPTWAVAGTSFEFDGSESTGDGTLEGRFDWEDDGLFDTAWNTDLEATHTYTVAGDYTIRLIVKDDSGLTNSDLQNITVVPGDPVQLDLSPQVVIAAPGEVIRFQVSGEDQYDNLMYNPEVTWSLADPDAGVIDASGVFTASEELGAYANVIQVESDGVSATASVRITEPPSAPHAVWEAFDISQITGTLQTYPEIAANPDRGSYLTVWRDERAGGFQSRIYGRLVSASGRVFAETLIYSQTAQSNLVPWTDVAYHQKAGDRYVVVWNAGDSQFPDLYGQLVAYNGILISDTFQIDSGEDYHYDFHPTLAHDSNNGPTLVVWSERWNPLAPDPSGAQISGRFVDGTGSPLAPVFKIGDLANYNDPAIPAAAFNATDNEYLVVWAETYGQAVKAVYGQRLEWDGDLIGGAFTISALADVPDAFPDVAYDSANNEYLVVWHDKQGDDYDIFGQAVDADGTLIGAQFQVAAANNDQKHPTLDFRAGLQGGVYLVVWDDKQVGGGGNPDIFGRWIIGGDPATLGDPILLAGDDTLIQSYPALAYNGLTGKFLLGWRDSRESDIWGKLLTGLPRDLAVSDDHIWTSPMNPREDTSVAVKATVFNTFRHQLSGVDVDFYHGDPDAGGTLIGQDSLDFALGQHRAMAASDTLWDTTGLLGDQTIYAVVDPDDEFVELSEANNVASRTLEILPDVEDSTPPTGTLSIDGGAQSTDELTVTLTISATDEGGTGVQWVYLREWYLTQRIVIESAVYSDTAGILNNGSWTNRDIGWVRYDPEFATQGYSLRLTDSPGLHYVDAWFMDGAGNLSDPPPARDDINVVLDPSTIQNTGNWHFYRLAWTAGTPVTLTVETLAGDADIFVWPPGDTDAPDHFSNADGLATDQVGFEALSGSYRIAVYAAAPNTQYRLTVQPDMGISGFSPRRTSQPQATAKTLPLLPFVYQVDLAPPRAGWVARLYQVYLPLVLR